MRINNDIIMGLDVAEDKHFSWSGCENCNNGLGSDVYDCQAHFQNSDGDYDHYDLTLCPGCVLAWHNGEPLHEDCNNQYNL